MTDQNKTPTMPHEELYEEELVQDDAIISRAFWWSIIVLILVSVPVLGFIFWPRARAGEENIREKEVGEISNLTRDDAADMPAVHFTDITAESGIDFVHFNGATGEKLLPETMGGGCAFFDYDNDGDQDLLFVNGAPWPQDREAHAGDPPTMALYQNDGAGYFTDVTEETGLAVTFYGMGAAVGDYDDDGWTDVFITAVGTNRLLRNARGSFVDVTHETQVGGGDQWSSSAGFFDYDNDGDLDLFVCNYVRWSREIDFELDFTLNGRDRAYGPPTNYTGAQCALYRNEGDGSFSDVSEEAGIHVFNPVTEVPVAKALAIAFVDSDRDGNLDVLVANDTTRNFLFHNQGDGTFREIGEHAGVSYDNAGAATGAMGIDGAYFRNDDAIGIGIGNFAREMTSFYVADRDPLTFSDQSIVEGIGSPSRQKLSFGLFFFDYDLDGWLDLLQANGHLEDEINEVEPSQQYEQAAQLFWNCGPGARSCFAEVPEDATGDLATKIVGRGAAYADIDGDGDQDVLLTQVGRSPLLLRNDQDLGRHWLRLKLVGDGAANRDAIGAAVEIVVDGQTRRQMVMPTRSYLSQVELPLTFGLGDVARVEELRIRWPGGETMQIEGLRADQTVTIRESQTQGRGG